MVKIFSSQKQVYVRKQPHPRIFAPSYYYYVKKNWKTENLDVLIVQREI